MNKPVTFWEDIVPRLLIALVVLLIIHNINIHFLN